MPRYASRSWRSFDPDLVAQPEMALPTEFPCRVLGLDPGSLRTGFGVIDLQASGEAHVASGCIRATGTDLARRLGQIHQAVVQLIAQYQPTEVAIERVFMHRNADSALKLGQARGAALCAVVGHGASVHEYAPRAIKLAVVGSGSADKAQVSHMVQALLRIAAPATEDESDALAIALCHSAARRILHRVARSGVVQ
jgi:crossover junction endodeoxyribonuclease RuvC